ncbi:MAG: hypothetical protein CV087_21780 [Candidatus Brocadia sp. WS118]|nr:MAG: hypothetical protein CV087_21780 [Candidatus Brocadia sp. WS118]
MIKLICIDCGNYTYFEADAETVREVRVTPEGLLVGDVCWSDCNESEEQLLGTLSDTIHYALDPEEPYHSVQCARCGSNRVTIPFCEWSPDKEYQSVEEQIFNHREELKQLRKERRSHDNKLLLWKLQ